jgi:hypothetical protein
MKLFPGVRLNFSKSGLGLSLGAPGARISLNPKYGARATLGIPGTGLSYSQKIGGSKPQKAASQIPASAKPGTPIVTCPHCHKAQHVPANIDHNTTLVCAYCQEQFTPPTNLFVDHDDEPLEIEPPSASTSPPTPATRQVHFVLYSPLGEKQLADHDPSDSTLEEQLEKLSIGDGSRLSLIAKSGFVQVFRSGEKTFRIEWRDDKGENRYIGEQPDVTAVRVFQNFANGQDISGDAQWKTFAG